MSVQAIELVTDAAQAVGDPKFSRIFRPTWRAILNRASRDLSKKLKLVKHKAIFDIETDDEYALPDDCIQVVSFQWNDTPADPSSWRWLGEKFEDEFRAATEQTYPDGDPCEYIVFTDTFHLYPRPDAAIVGGGKITYWGHPDPVTDEGTQLITVRDTARDVLLDRMVILGERLMERFDKAAEYEKEWIASLTTDRDKLEDRSADRRARIRTGPFYHGER